MKSTSNKIRIICEIGIISALGFVFDELQGIISKGLFPNGGSIGFAMIAVLIMAFRRGWLPAIVTGLIIGSLDLATGAYIVHPVQMLLDYVFPYAVVGIAGFFRPMLLRTRSRSSQIMVLIIGTVLGGLLKFVSHYVAGVVYWANPDEFAWKLQSMNVYLYCFIYNMAFIGPSIVITGALLIAIYLRAPQIFNLEEREIKTDVSDKKDISPIIISSACILGGGFLFVYYLIDYIKSFWSETYPGAYDFSFNGDSMVIFILALFLVILGVNALVAYFKKTYSRVLTSGVITTIMLASFTYGVARLIRCYVKNKDPKTYWIWFAIGLASLLLSLGLFLYYFIKNKKEKAL